MNDVTSDVVDLVEAALLARPKTSTRGREWTFVCPAHADSNPSARYNQERHVWWCHCGAKGGMIDLAGRLGVEVPKLDTPMPAQETVYTYADEAGTPLFEVVKRRENGTKKFLQRRPDGTYNLGGVKRVPYRLPELAAAPKSEPVFIVEGEKDVESLRLLGLVATCNPGGAGKWRDEYTPYVVGHPVVLIADNDAPGRAHIEAVMDSLKRAGQPASLVEVIPSLPGVPDKGDVTDYLDNGGTVDYLLSLVPRPVLDWQHVYDVLTKPKQERKVVPTGFRDFDALTNGGLRGGQLLVVAARPSVGKSAWGAGVAYHVAAAGGKVAFLSMEMTDEEVARRVARYGPVSTEENVYVNDMAGLSIERLTQLVNDLHGTSPVDIVIVDYLQLMQGSGGYTGNRAQDVGAMTAGLKGLAKTLRIPVIALCQLNREVERRNDEGKRRFKLSDLRESGNIEQDADIVAFLDREEMYDEATLSRGTATLQVEKHREGARADLPLGFYGAATLFYDLQSA